jgi:hypothetical protein
MPMVVPGKKLFFLKNKLTTPEIGGKVGLNKVRFF